MEEAMKVSQSTAEQDQQRHLEYERRLREEEERALQLSQEEKRTEDAERSRPQTLAGLEASLDDALRHTAEGRDHESREDGARPTDHIKRPSRPLCKLKER